MIKTKGGYMKKLLIVGLLFCNTALAGDLTVQGGFSQSPNSNYGNGSTFVARYETPIVDSLNIAIDGSYHGPQGHNHDSGTYGDMSGFSLLVGPVYHAPLNWRIKPYIGALIGWSWWDFERSQDMVDKGIEINLGDSLAWKAVIGANYAIGGNWSINVEYFRFGSWVPKESYYSSNGQFANVLSSDENLGQEENGFVVGLKYKW